MINIVGKEEIMKLTGYSETQTSNLIRKAKKTLIDEGFDWYKNKRVGRVPITTVESILGFQLVPKHDIISSDLRGAVMKKGEHTHDSN